jgi:hypothetical protein
MSERDFDPLGAELEGLLASERQRPEAAPETRDRVLARVWMTLGAGPLGDGGGGGSGGGNGGGGGGGSGGGGGGGSGGGSGGAAASGSATSGAASTGVFGSAVVKALSALLGALALGAAGAGIYGSLRSSSPDEPLTARAPLLIAPEEMDPEMDDAGAPVDPAEARAEAPAEAPLPPASAPRRSASQEAGAVGRDAALAAERALLETARAALARGQRVTAFDALTKHAQAFPRGRLGEERDGLFIQALISAGRIDEARARLARFRRSYPRSMLLQAFDASLRADSETDEEGSSQ